MRTLLLLVMAFALGLPLDAVASDPRPRQRFRLKPGAKIHVSTLSFTKGEGIGFLGVGEVKSGEYHPTSSNSLGSLGSRSRSCSIVMNALQELPLSGMLARNYITPEDYESLKDYEKYLKPEQVIFTNVYTVIPRSEYDATKDRILPSQITVAPVNRGPNSPFVPITLATLHLVNGFVEGPKGLVRAPLPFATDPAFKHAVKGLFPNESTFDFELGRAFQVTPGTIDHAINNLLIHAAHIGSMWRLKDARIFMHSMEEQNTKAYMERYPFLEIVARDQNNPNNVVLAARLDLFFTDQKPWSFSAPMQALLRAAPEKMTIPGAYSLISRTRTSARINYDYHTSDGRVSRAPIIVRFGEAAYQKIFWQTLLNLGITEPSQMKAVAEVANTSLGQNESSPNIGYIDPIAKDYLFAGNQRSGLNLKSVSISNLDPIESKADPTYELKVLFNTLMQYDEYLWQLKVADPDTEVRKAVYAVMTTDPGVMKRLEALEPFQKEKVPWTSRWALSASGHQNVLEFSQSTVGIYYYKIEDMERLRHKHPEIFYKMQTNPSLVPGYWNMQFLAQRPFGL